MIFSVFGKVECPLAYDGHCTEAPSHLWIDFVSFSPLIDCILRSTLFVLYSAGCFFLLAIFSSICFWFNSILVHCTFCADDDAGSAAEGDEWGGGRRCVQEVRYFPFSVGQSWVVDFAVGIVPTILLVARMCFSCFSTHKFLAHFMLNSVPLLNISHRLKYFRSLVSET